jgi:hypothetical protein
LGPKFGKLFKGLTIFQPSSTCLPKIKAVLISWQSYRPEEKKSVTQNSGKGKCFMPTVGIIKYNQQLVNNRYTFLEGP